jgi:hypothetical protein
MSKGLVLDDQHAHVPAAARPAGRISPAYRKLHTCRQHHAALTGGMTCSEPASVNLCLVRPLPLAGPRAAWA